MVTTASSTMAAPIRVSTARHLRGSSLLLVGRLLALLMGFGTQVLMVRYLTKSDYGAFAFALSVTTLGATIGLAGLNKAVARFVPIYHERGDDRSMLGTIFLAACIVVALGALLAASVVLFQAPLARIWVHDALSMKLLLLMVAIVPLLALNNLLEDLLAVLAKPRAIFFRKHVLGPLLKLAAILIVMATSGTVRLLAICYLAAHLLGVGLYLRLVQQSLQRLGVWSRAHFARAQVRSREILGYGVPLLALDAVTILKTTMAVILLQYYWDPAQVADFRAVVPLAGLNLVVLQSFRFLFVPFASRLLVRNDVQAINDLFWQSAIWTSIVTFPIFATCCFLAKPVILMLFEHRYVGSSTVLVLLAIGNYFNAALGLNSYTLQVYARVGLTVAISVVTVACGLGLSLWLIPHHGAVGAAIAASASLVLQNVLNHLAMFYTTGVRFFEWRQARVYGVILAAIAVLTSIHTLAEPSLPVSVASVVVVSSLVVLLNRGALQLGHTFPELARVPLLAFLLGGRQGGRS